MTGRRFELAILGDGVLSAICAVRLARLLGPEQVLVVTRDREFAGTCPELLVPDLLDPAALELVRDYIVMEWDRFAENGPAGSRIHERTICLLDPVQVYAEFEANCTGMTVLAGQDRMHAIDGYLIAGSSIHPCKSHIQIPAARFSGRHEAIIDMDGMVQPDCPVLLDHTGSPCRQFIPVGSNRTMVNTLEGSPLLRPDGRLDIAATFPIHSALAGLLGQAGLQ
jgi:hypothetical protein